MRNLLLILIASIFLLGTFIPGARTHASVEGVQIVTGAAGQAFQDLHQELGSGDTQGAIPDCPASTAKKNGKTSSHACCPASCVADLVILHSPISPDWKGLPAYLPMIGSLTDASGHCLEHPPKH